ncbi:hypothetical protein BSK59_13205 [Paenibacillus odorifer]|uniref:hypothetical protein n=1 Tax=Paenibacillus odorifer TaxID=189426 RepID=UPI00096CDE93|nr:hypothetical protein [Paenibacillus odorifer]OME55430.1 hypothetical protein BSK59_13205 [Paenibacillus odorifer]
MIKVTFAQLKELDGKPLDILKPYEEPTEPEKGMLEINGGNIFYCFQNKVSCSNDTFAFVHFYDKSGNEVANVSLFNYNNECLIIEPLGKITSETTLRVLNYNYQTS